MWDLNTELKLAECRFDDWTEFSKWDMQPQNLKVETPHTSATTTTTKSQIKIAHDNWNLSAKFRVLTYIRGNLPVIAKAIDTAGLKWAPEICPSVYIRAIKDKPHTIAIPKIVKDWSLSTSADPHPANIKIYVPRSSAIIWVLLKETINYQHSRVHDENG